MPIDPFTGLYIPSPPTGLGYGGSEYGFSPYGSALLPRNPFPPGGGFGGSPYGTGSYGSLDTTFPYVTSATSLDGFRIEVFFSEEMRVDSTLLDPTSYILTSSLGAPSIVIGVVASTIGDLGGATSIILTHSGTTLGGTYEMEIVGDVRDLADNPINNPQNKTTLLTIGEPPTFTVSATSGNSIEIQFSQDMLLETDFSPGIEDTGSYSFTSEYPVSLIIQDITHPVGTDKSKVSMQIQGMTSVDYTAEISPSDAIVYDGTVLPSTSTGFTGVEVGTGISSAGSTGLLLTKNAAVSYGWDFIDTSGKVLPSSTFRVDITLDATAAVYTPGLFDAALATFLVSDGAIEVTLVLTRVSGVDVIDVISGGFSASVPASWSSGQSVITLVRNQKADHYAMLFNGVPLVSAPATSFTGVPTISSGVRFLLGPVYKVVQFPIKSLSFTSTQTVFSSAWNFMHGGSSTFTGSTALTRDRLFTERGPLVKGWGDATPATVQDVTLKINSVEVDIDDINPYIGRIIPAVPIPLMPPGTTTVEVDYKWFPNPQMEFVGLNTEGLVLNKFDRTHGHHEPGENPLPTSSEGSPDTQRFPMGLVLPEGERPSPILIGHRYIGFEREYTAAVNSPTTLLLNQNPHRVSVQDLEETHNGVSVSFDGNVKPTEDESPWVLEGKDSGFVGTGSDEGLYVLIDDSTGSYSEGTAALYVRDVDFSFPTSAVISGRILVSGYQADGIFTGIGFGFHDNKNLYVVGCLVLNDVKHIGMLVDGTIPHERDGWVLGPSAEITIIAEDTFSISTSEFPSFVETGSRFQILEGNQAGVYRITSSVNQTDGTTTVTLDTLALFPADFRLFNNNKAEAFFEVLWDEDLTTYKLTADVEGGIAQLSVGGFLSGSVITLESAPAFPAQTSLVLSTSGKGKMFWGSLSRIATSTSKWSFYRYGTTPDLTTFHFRGIVVAAEMSDLPEDDLNHEWYITQGFGQSEIDSSGDTLLLKSTSESPDRTVDLTFGYARLEPFLRTGVLIDVDSEFQVESGTLGAGDAQIVIRNTEREVILGTILYKEGGTPFRRLIHPAVVSLSGLLTPTNSGWESSTGLSVSTTARQQVVTFTQALGEEGTYFTDLVLDSDSTGGRIIEARMAITSYTANGSGDVGPIFGAEVGTSPSARTVAMTFLDGPARLVLTSDGTPLATFPFDWTDREFHSYRLLADPTTSTVTLVVDDLVLGTADLTLFDPVTTDTLAFIGSFGTDVVSVFDMDAFSVAVMPPVTAKRTLGILRGVQASGGDVDDFDAWEIPRSDALAVSNSDPGAVIEEMDWRSPMSMRLRLDPGWGATLFRPDLPPPPYFTGDFATQTTEPSAGWINVEYRRLPRSVDTFGSVSFGSLDPRSVTQQRWKEVRYRIYTHPNEDFIAPHHMVLNQWNIISSGELPSDVTIETVQVVSVTSSLISLRSAHITADRVFNVIEGSTTFSTTSWAFDPETQTIILTTPLSGERVLVTVTFAPGKPVTNTYLETQPLLDSITLLNEGTPPVPRSQVAEATRQVEFGSMLNDPSDTLSDDPDFILNDPYRLVEFRNTEDALYEALEFISLDDGKDLGVLSTICDGPAPEHGLIELALEGTSFSDSLSQPGGVAVHVGSPSLQDQLGPFPQDSILHASGGSIHTGGVLGPGSAVMYPSYPSVPTTGGSIARYNLIRLKLNSVFTDVGALTEVDLKDDLDIGGTVSDNVPASLIPPGPDNEPNPDGVPGTTGNGATIGFLVDGAGLYGRLGPWGGSSALAQESQLYGSSSSQPTGIPSSGIGLILQGGSVVGQPTETTLNIEAAN